MEAYENGETMSTDKWLGKIARAEFGFGGYDDAMVGLSLTFSGEYGTTDFFGTWAARPASAEWTVESQRGHFADAVIKLRDTLGAAKCKHVAQLVGTPVEVTCERGRMVSWRVLEEVL